MMMMSNFVSLLSSSFLFFSFFSFFFFQHFHPINSR